MKSEYSEDVERRWGYEGRPTSDREVGPLNWTQEHKSVWDGPPSKATGHAPRPRAIGPCFCRTTGHRAGELANSDRASHCAGQRASPVGTFSKSAILHRFPNVYTLRAEIFRIFYPFTSTYDPYEWWKVSCNRSARFLRNPEDRHTHRQTRQLYIYERASPVGTFSKSAILHRFPNVYTLRAEIFRIFYPFTSTYDPYEWWKFHVIGSHVFEKSERQTHTQTNATALYIDGGWAVVRTLWVSERACIRWVQWFWASGESVG